ncbi:protease HtpX [Neiella marina]|uniref:Protease HtpX n=1 Tax=Neiella marina TaxID=508461 RepID=A0A8J2U564_9GAMM|nr:protease HtpX [Neiella marina]GGA77773.1 protease HtpX [Neiella marina]
MKRIALFLLTNIAVMVVFSIALNIIFALFGIQDTRSITGLAIFAGLFGFGGAFVSLYMSKWMAKRSTGAHVIEQPRNDAERWLVETVERQARTAGIAMPEVAIYDSPDMNAFATGPSKNNSLVAVSTGLLTSMDKDEVEAVLGHEVSHVANGDMVTMTLIQGIVNTFVIFLARLIAQAISSAVARNDEDGQGLGWLAYTGVVIVLEIVFGLLASIIVMWFSRRREYIADAGGAYLTSNQTMIKALRRLSRSHEPQMEGQLAAFCINGKSSMAELFMSHPPIEKRIAALEAAR